MGTRFRLVFLLVAVFCWNYCIASCGFNSPEGGCAAATNPKRQRRDTIVFPGEEQDDFNPITRYLTPEQIDRLNAIETLEEVVHSFSNESIEEPIVSARILPVQLSSRFGGGPGEARNADVRQAVLAKCQPTLQPVPIKKPDDITIMYWPYCVQLERCGGCCINDRQQSCQPTKTEIVPFRVNRFLLNGMKKNGTEIVHLEKHVQCRCNCIVKSSDCTALQEYRPRECRCVCINADEKRKCLSEPNKIWDNSDCRCRCREYPEEGCTTGLHFDLNTCTCVANPESRRRLPDNTYKVGERRRRWQNRTRAPLT